MAEKTDIYLRPRWVYRGTVLRVVDGDTVDVEVDLGFRICAKLRFRLLGIDAPETYGVRKNSREYKAGMRAKRALIARIGGKEIELHTFKDKRGKYGRWLAILWLPNSDEESINSWLIKKGHAKEYIP